MKPRQPHQPARAPQACCLIVYQALTRAVARVEALVTAPHLFLGRDFIEQGTP